jgi:hypothetical protein
LQCNQKQQDNSELTRVSKKHFLDTKYAIMLTALWQGVARVLATENNIALSKKGKNAQVLRLKETEVPFHTGIRFAEFFMRFVC